MNKLFRNKKAAMTASLIIGVLMLSVPTLAEINSKTGYVMLKDSVKTTAGVIFENANNYTSEISLTVKDNDKVILQSTVETKTDNIKRAVETNELTKELGVEKIRYSYRDSKMYISLDDDNIYHVSEYAHPIDSKVTGNNPFDQDSTADIEKIFDAAVAGLKDNVIVTGKDDGSKEFSGTISENQVPALINTVSSYFFKTQFVGNKYQAERSGLPQLTNDIYIKNVTGKASANKDGMLENIYGTATLSGKEKDGTNHELTVEVLVYIANLNKTVVNPPDLTGKKVEKNVIQNNPVSTDGSAFVGKYKNDIVKIENGNFVKTGERHVEIARGDLSTIEGRYYEEYFGEYGKDRKPIAFTFNASIKENQKGGGEFTFTNNDGKSETGHIYLNERDGNIDFFTPSAQKYNSESFSGNFIRDYSK